MTKANRAWLVVLLVAGVALIPASTAGAATITGCVNKKTGEVRIRSGKAAKHKCPKGWAKLRWNTRGPAGAQGLPGANGTNGTNGTNGAPGPSAMVKDAAGNVVGQFLGVYPAGANVFLVLRDGGIYVYLGSGQVYSLTGPEIEFKAGDCSGTAYVVVPTGFGTDTWLGLLGGPFRFVFRTVNGPTFGTTSAWKSAGTTESVSSLQLYHRDSTTGTCTANSSTTTGTLLALTSVQAPPDFTGPLTIG